MPFSTLAVPFDQYAALPTPQVRWVLMALARYSDQDGWCWPSMRQLARDTRMSVASVCRHLKSLADLGVFQRSRTPGMRYRYRLAEAYVPRWPGRVSPKQSGVPHSKKQRANQKKHYEIQRPHNDLSHPGALPSLRALAAPDTHQPQQTAYQHESRQKPREYLQYDHDDSSRWKARLRGWERRRMWLAWWGPTPGEPGCWAPV